MQNAHKTIIISALISLVSAIIFFFATFKQPLEIYPENSTFFDFEVVSNIAEERGFAKMEIDPETGHMHFLYNYERGSDFPFAIWIFHAHELARHLKLGNFEYVDLDIDPILSQDFTISLYFYIPGFSSLAHAETHRPYSMRVRVQDERIHYHYRLMDFATPAWWLTHFQSKGSIPQTNRNNFTHLTITNYLQSDVDTSLQVVIKRLRFVDSVPKRATNAAIFGLVIFIFSFIFLPKIKKAMKEWASEEYGRPLGAPPSSIDRKTSKYTDETAQTLFEYIDKNLSNPLLSLESINKETGISSFVVNEILKDKKDMQYKNYVDTLRMEAAKKMLAETEHQISVIAEQVGYCYSNSFSRIFGKYCGMTPNEYRKKFGGKLNTKT